MANLPKPVPVFSPDVLNESGSALESENSPIFIRAATLISRDARQLARFYTETLGFELIRQDEGGISLGAGGTPFLRLKNRPDAKPFDPSSSGLFHIAYLLPGRADLASWFVAARAAGALFEGASDHAVSEAFYLTDPDGNGIEIYVDRNREAWPRDEGGYAMTTEAMALRDLVASAGLIEAAAPQLPAGTRIGHIHLQTGNAERSTHFWQNSFGLAETHRRPGVRFLSWGGYHHHIAINNWRSHGAGPHEADSAGLSGIEFSMRDADELQALAHKNNLVLEPGSSLNIIEPDGLSLTFHLI